MALFLSEQEVVQLLPMNECIGRTGPGIRPRRCRPGREQAAIPHPHARGFFHFMAAADGAQGVFGYKAYPSFAGPGGAKMMVMLYDYESGQLLACLEAGRLGQIRTGAASGLATRYMGPFGRVHRGRDRLRVPGPLPAGSGLRRAVHQGGEGVQPTPGATR